ncbi:MAG: ABC transporter substrate-binding protein, partial [Burkholderiales bacterium]
RQAGQVRLLTTILCLAALAPFAGAPALAQTSAAVALYEGADRTQRLAEGAKKEGVVTIYTSAPPDDMAAIAAALERKHGVKLQFWRASSEKVVQRALTEARGGRFDVDVIETNGPDIEALHREKILQEVRSPHLAELVPGAIPPHREWVSMRLNIWVAAYNTKLVRKEELPKSYDDLAHPRWKGKLGIEGGDANWFAAVVKEMGEAKGLKVFRDIVAANGMSVRVGHTLLANLVVAGEIPLALTVYNFRVEQIKAGGAPIEWFIIPPTIARFQGMGLARRAPRPHAAVLYFDFMLTDGQELLLKRGFIPTSKGITTPLSQFPMTMLDPKVSLDEHDRWSKLFKEIIVNPSR